MTPFFALLAALTLPTALCSSYLNAAEPDKGTAHSFRMALASQMTMDILGKKQAVTADTGLNYTWQVKDRDRTLVLDSMSVRAVFDGVEQMNIFTSREKFINMQQGKTNVISAEDGPEQLKNMLQSEFGTPLCKLEVDAQGKEIKRTNMAGKNARPTMVDLTVANTQLFHPPFDPASNEWSNDTQVAMGNGGFAKGKLTYKKQTNGQKTTVCKVSGTLINERFEQPNSPVIVKQTRYIVTGEQTYDPALKEWVTGKMNIDVSNQMEANGKAVGSAQGTMLATFERLPAGR